MMKFALVLLFVALVSAGSPPFAAPKPSSKKAFVPGSDKVLHNAKIVEGDMVLPDNGRTAIKNPENLWPNGVIIYQIDDNIGCKDDSWNCFVVTQGMKAYEQLTCIEFKERTTEDHWVTITYNWDNQCWSHVGYQPTYDQYVSLGDGCFWAGLLVHELGHTVGFYHEHNRYDRDDYIRVIWENIYPGSEENFYIHEESEENWLDEKFDYKSVMLYEENAFSKDWVSPTIEVLQPGVVIGPVWERASLALADVRRTHKLYNCTDTLEGPTRRTRKDELCNFNDNHSCGFVGDKWQIHSDGHIKTSEGGELMSVTYLASQKSGEGCLTFNYKVENGAALKVSSKKFSSGLERDSAYPHKTLWKSNDATSTWEKTSVPLSTMQPFKVYFYGSGEVAIDDITIKYSAC